MADKPKEPTSAGKGGAQGNPKVLRLPRAEHKVTSKNFLTSAVCELRFPTLLEYEEKPPIEFQKLVRKEFPIYAKVGNLNVQAGAADVERQYNFRSQDQEWALTFRSSAIALEWMKYTEFKHFQKKLEGVIDASKKVIDSKIFTRVGLRYLNEIPIGSADPKGWVRAELAGVLQTENFGAPEKFFQEVRGLTHCGRYTLRHGLKLDFVENPTYVLDFDFYDDNVEVSAAADRVAEFKSMVYDLFRWCLGQKSEEYLGLSR